MVRSWQLASEFKAFHPYYKGGNGHCVFELSLHCSFYSKGRDICKVIKTSLPRNQSVQVGVILYEAWCVRGEGYVQGLWV